MNGLIAFSANIEPICKFHIVWSKKNVSGSIKINRGNITSLHVEKGETSGNSFYLTGEEEARLTVEVTGFNNAYGPSPTVISVKTPDHPFSFFLRDVNAGYPIYIPAYKVAVVVDKDNRSYAELEKDILSRNLQTKIQRIESEEETSFGSVAQTNRDMSVPIWLGIGRDMRLFEISEELEDMAQEGKIIRPKYASSNIKLADTNYDGYIYALGRGVGVKNNITRRLDEGILPIYHSKLVDDDIIYHTISFVSFAEIPLNASTNRGTNYIVSDKHSSGRTFKEEHLKELGEQMKNAFDFQDDMVLYSRTTIENTGTVPRYAWIKCPRPGNGWWCQKIHEYDENTGFSSFGGDSVFCISQLNGEALANEEISILLLPGEKAEFDFFLPHTPVSKKRAYVIVNQSFEKRLNAARSYWKEKLDQAASISVPEKRIQEMFQAGLLHLDLVTYGNGYKDVVSTNVGVYSPIGTESSPIIQFYLSVGWHELAKKALNYFLETQLSNGCIQNYGDYTVETGAALWSIGEYIRYTNDFNWLTLSREKIIKSCDYLIEWRNRNKRDKLIGRGYGMIEGQVADPEDSYRSFMLNGYAYLGLSRVAEALMKIDPKNAYRIQKEANDWKHDIRRTVKTLFGISPVVSLGDGSWVPTLPAWPEADGPRGLLQEKETFWTHGTFTATDVLLGPLYLVFCEVVEPASVEAKMLLDYNSELFFQGNAAFSQPYYSRHNWLQARYGMTKPFLNTYYNTIAAHADRETYTFWEHMYRVSQHKTHEEAWFLMETRWMLYMEEGSTLRLFKVIPRNWLNDGQVIELKNVKSYFGNLNVKVVSLIESGTIEALIEVDMDRKPEQITIRLPHPSNLYPKRVVGGTYDKKTETVTIDNISSRTKVKLEF
ncbi:hypothetical protein D1164_01350 [Mariniphaga sediminis]|uniref:Glycosyl-hydrolase family 116 catalytic region domain-containing protein n=1 Tax=Mariniphaga sediminis TaxID=1628158 RepID=A0A399D5Y2_9BACT|nr:hypothetical protein D1164_01350 [Mariniphaga sediminis]